MIEPEMAFADLFQAMTNAEQFVKYVIKYTLGSCVEDMKFFEKFMDKELMTRLLKVVNEPFVRLPYRDAVVLLQDEIAKDPSKWKYPEMKFGTDFSTGESPCYMLFCFSYNLIDYRCLDLLSNSITCLLFPFLKSTRDGLPKPNLAVVFSYTIILEE
jgi:aspartyl/asparaginyl-tRNA synthetase